MEEAGSVGESGASESSAPPPSPQSQPAEAPSQTGGAPQTAPVTHQNLAGQDDAGTDTVKRSTIKPIPPEGGRQRNADGSFKAGRDLKSADLGFKPHKDRSADPAENFPGKSKVAPAQSAPVPGAPADPNAPAPAKFKFAGVEWDSADHAERSLSSMRGSFRATEQRFHQEAEKAQGWYQHAQGLQAELDRLKGGGSPSAVGAVANPAGQPATPATDSNDPLSGIDMGVYQHLVQNSGPEVAAAWLASEVAKTQETRIMGKVESMVAPFKEAQARHQETQRIVGQVENVYAHVAGQRDETGAALYPEFQNPEHETQIGEMVGILMANGLKEDVALSPFGLHMAVLLHRDAMRISGQGSTSSAPVGNAAAQAVAAAILQAPQSQEPVTGPSSRPAQPGQPMTREDQVKRDIRSVRIPDKDLGFVRRSAPV